MSDKPAIAQEQYFVVEESTAYKVCRRGAIWMNKLFFSSLFLLVIWLFLAYTTGDQACSEGLGQAGSNSTQDLDSVAEGTCSVFLTPTATYLGAMTVLSFLASLAFGSLGLIVGKNVIESTRAADEVGAPRDEEE